MKTRNIITCLFLVSSVCIYLSGCASSFPTVELKKDYDFPGKNSITVYAASLGNDKVDDTYARVMCLDLQARGYKVINVNDALKVNSDNIIWTNHKQVVKEIINKTYLPVSDIIAVVKTQWDSIRFITDISEEQTVYGDLTTTWGMNVARLSSQVAFYDRKTIEPVLSFSAEDTSHVITEKGIDYLRYAEFSWMTVARQLIKNLSDIDICRNENISPVKNKYNVSFWVDESYREAFPKTWIDRLKLRVLYANDILRSQLGIELVIAEFREWNTHFNTSLKQSAELLNRTPNPEDNMIRIGITLDKKLKTNWTEKSKLGHAFPLLSDEVITAQPSFPGMSLWNPLEEAITIAHETGHLFGAVHLRDKESIMYPNSGYLAYQFDDINKQIINSTKDVYLSNNKEEIINVYADRMLQIKSGLPENTFQVLSAISQVIINQFAKSSFHFQTPEKLSSFLTTIIPDSAHAYAVAGYIEYKRSNLIEAKDLFIKSVELNQDFAEAHWYLGEIFRKLDKEKEAELHQDIAKPFLKFWVLDDEY